MRIALTIGDPAGVGPEVLVKFLNQLEPEKSLELVVIGDQKVLELAGERFGRARAKRWLKRAKVVDKLKELESTCSSLSVLSLSRLKEKDFIPARASKKLGRAMIAYIQAGVELCQKGICCALITLPVSKESMLMAGSPYAGHTHFLSALDKREVLMMMVLAKLRVGLYSDHIPLRDVPKNIEAEKILAKLRLMNESLRCDFGIQSPKIGVLGLNPHAGEAGKIGNEDIKIIAPAIEQARREGMNVIGPIPADTAFWRARRGEFDALLAMYHDQGIAPLKTLDFRRVVNVTLGLSFVRTSPGHGTGYDIAWQGKADETGLKEAFKLALKLAKNRLKRELT